jgi:hypothetical protein
LLNKIFIWFLCLCIEIYSFINLFSIFLIFRVSLILSRARDPFWLFLDISKVSFSLFSFNGKRFIWFSSQINIFPWAACSKYSNFVVNCV